MDFIQRVVDLFSRLLQRIKAIGDMLAYNYLPSVDIEEEMGKFFWIFNW